MQNFFLSNLQMVHVDHLIDMYTFFCYEKKV